ncbi:type VII secretion target [Mycolicibacterium litorale]|uniref:type VII secretion target n=1 Tax=Mycolicibacterium litorale TaxID=758802 RepID=UPI003CE73D2B
MGAVQAARVDGAALVSIADRYDAAAGMVEAAVRTHLSALTFDGSAAGREYTAHGDMVRAAVDEVVVALHGWARSATGIAAQLRASAARYAQADADMAARVW